MEESSKELLKKVNDLLESEGNGVDIAKIDKATLLIEHLMPALRNSKDVLSPLHSYSTPKRQGVVGRFKTFIEGKISNIVINVIERQSIKQQKFNDLLCKTLEVLAEEASSSSKPKER